MVLAGWLQTIPLPADCRTAMLAALAENPQAARWSGQHGEHVFALAARPLPQGAGHEHMVPAMLQLTRAAAVQELIVSKAVADHFVPLGLDDIAVLKTALRQTACQTQVLGRVRGLEFQAAAEEGFALAWVAADASSVAAVLLQPSSVANVRGAYRELLHRQMRAMMDDLAWAKALGIWDHLASRDMATPRLCLDAAQCCHELEKPADAQRILQVMIDRFEATASFEELERAGDIALALPGEDAQKLALRGFTLASQRLLHQVAPPDPQPSQPNRR